MDMKNPGILKVELTGKSNSNKLAQMNVSISTNGIPVTSITFNGTDGEYITKETEVSLWSKYTVTKLFFAESGLELKDIKFILLKNLEGNPFEGLTEKNGGYFSTFKVQSFHLVAFSASHDPNDPKPGLLDSVQRTPAASLFDLQIVFFYISVRAS